MTEIIELRPWGSFEILTKGENYQVKRLIVAPGGVLSLQKHKHRREHWVVASGTAEVTIGEDTFTLNSCDSVDIDVEAVHRLANRQTIPLIVIEIQHGSYLEEDDIIRLEDIYDRETINAPPS
ncbi:phosphomannose isomerase type II C-terminal cupin domain [Thalassospira tepidiphila]|uniref:phosphomannose isomerase type II C-terminal cupin domain n=1 Tax=Thalassospira tepidiphila TaxID=393657 RepID=UPI003AA7D738